MIGRGRLVLALAVVGAGAAADAQTFKYCAYGDSITCGKYDGGNCPAPSSTVDPLHPSSGYPARLRQASRLNCPVDGSTNCMVYNYGKSGEKTGAGLTRLDNVLDQQNFDVLLLMEGTNDLFSNISNNTIKNNLQAMENKAKAKGVDTVFTSIIRFHPNGNHGYGHGKDAQIQNLKNDLSVIAVDRGRWFANPWSVLCPTSGCFNDHYAHPLDSGVHPDASGYNRLADAFQATVQQAPVPAAPSLQSPANGAATDSSKVSWGTSNNATWYQVQWDDNAGNQWLDGKAVCTATTCSWTIPGLALGNHTWRVRARNPRGRSAWSPTRNFDLVTSLPGIELTLSPGSLDFGVIEVGSGSAPGNATLENTGELQATGLAFGLTGSAGFSAATGGCPGTLAAGASCSVSASFAPTGAGPAVARLVVTSNQGVTAELDLAGQGVAEGAGLTPVTLEVDPEGFLSDGNRVFEPGETVDVAPGWRNDEPAQQSLQGTAAGYAGPAGADYSLVLSAADYGNIGPGQTASCLATGVCYRMGIDDPATRPAPHWDATFEETPSDGATKTWSLHIGDSFVDVPRTNPFYRAVEGVFHHGVTSGCSATEYCPAGLITRAQMAVFLLAAVEGGGYSPSSCTPGAAFFADVPAGSPFCPWIEELAARGVTSGCGGGNYCPNALVTRDQMAVFLLKNLEGSSYTPPSCSGIFADVGCPSPFADWIEEVLDRGIVMGCRTGPLAYCPANPVTRAEMAVLVVRTFGIPAYGP